MSSLQFGPSLNWSTENQGIAKANNLPNELMKIEKMLASWMQDNNTTNWSNGLRFVQFMKNGAFHSAI